MEFEKTTYMTMLYDFYGSLLTDKQKEYLELYYEQDLTLSEISEELGVSRQAVYDNIKRSDMLLAGYEKQLQLVTHFQQQSKLLKQLHQHVKQHYPTDSTLQTIIKQLRKEV